MLKKSEVIDRERREGQALSVAGEQPCKEPGNWRWVKNHTVCALSDGEKIEGKEYPYLEAKYLRGDKNPRIVDKGRYVEKGTNVILVDGENSGEIFEVQESGYMGSTFKALNINHQICSQYMLYFIASKKDLLKKSKIGSAIPHLNKKLFFDLDFPFPPFNEQQRIVKRIESLFSKLDAAKEKVEKAMQGSKLREKMILRKAVSGELTKKWRLNNGVSKDAWREISLKECGTWFGGGTPAKGKKEYWDQGTIPWITSKDMKGKRVEDSLLHITQKGVEHSSANYCEKPAVLFVVRSGILRRVFPVCMVNVPFTVNQDLKAVIPEKISQSYLYWACTAYEKDIRDACLKSGTTVESIETKKLFSYKIPLPGDEEQRVIVDVIEGLMTKEDDLKKLANHVIEVVKTLKKSILAMAFRGELGTNNPEEQNSIELFKQLR